MSLATEQPLRFQPPVQAAQGTGRWQVQDIAALFELPFTELLWRALSVHREHHAPAQVELATLLSIKTGGCPEDCAYCPQSVHYDTGVEAGKLMDAQSVREAARTARAAGATRFCMGAAWRAPKDRDVEAVAGLVRVVKEAGGRASDIVRMTWFITDKSAYKAGGAAIGAAYKDTIGRHFPAITVIFVSGLVEDRAKIEIEATAFING